MATYTGVQFFRGHSVHCCKGYCCTADVRGVNMWTCTKTVDSYYYYLLLLMRILTWHLVKSCKDT